MMNHEELFTNALGLKDSLYVKSIDFKPDIGELHLHIDFKRGARFTCPVCGAKGQPVHDTKERTWSHLNFFQYKTYIHFWTPRIECDQDGVRLIDVPWASPGSGFTLLFEAMVMQLARVMPVSQIAVLVDEHDEYGGLSNDMSWLGLSRPITVRSNQWALMKHPAKSGISMSRFLLTWIKIESST